MDYLPSDWTCLLVCTSTQCFIRIETENWDASPLHNDDDDDDTVGISDYEAISN